MHTLTLYASLGWLLITGFAGQCSAAPPQGAIIIAALGDSITAGYGLPSAQAYPARLQALLAADGVQARLVNHGVSGDTSAGGASRISAVIAEHPDFVIVALGGNDLLRGVPPAVTKRNLEAIVAALHDANIPFLIAGQHAPMTLGSTYADSYNAMFCDLATRYQGQCVPNLLQDVYDLPGMMQPDHIHPSATGADVIAHHLAPLVEAGLRRE